ncbi:hypothetical protein DFJ63DRAFT_313757 [Scheffersomyces coipomensis]|uniref:uncharacterized protein n=1 Tax=Scheffersomyces coipomensis TaxID=1788519 RepID=UPI00315CF8DF
MILTHIHLLLGIILSLFILPTNGAFIKAQTCNLVDSGFKIAPFVIDAALDEANQKLKFLLNTKVTSFDNVSDTTIQISDVNATTNRYTTFHIEIDFMGKNFITDNKRFCDMLAVKNNTQYQESPRFPYNDPLLELAQSSSSSTSTSPIPTQAPGILPEPFNTTINSKRFYKRDNPFYFKQFNNTNFATSNTTIERIFSNATGGLIQCPLFINDSLLLYYEADISQHFHRLGSYSVRFSVVSNDDSSQVIGCNKAYITPVQPESVSTVLLLGILILLVVTAIINIITITYSSFQESSNPLLFRASTICNEELLRQLDASVPRIIIYLQFALFIGGLNLQYPGFYQPLIGQIRWCALLGVSLINRSDGGPQRITKQDNVYTTMNVSGLKSLTLFSSDESIVANWPNFILTFIIVVGIVSVAQQLYMFVRYIVLKLVERYSDSNVLMNRQAPSSSYSLFEKNPNYLLQKSQFSFKKHLYLMLGQVIEGFLLVFAVPFLVLTTYMFSRADDIKKKGFRPLLNPNALQYEAFSETSSYDQLFLPLPINATFSSTTPTPNFFNKFNLTGLNNHPPKFNFTNTLLGANSSYFNATNFPKPPPMNSQTTPNVAIAIGSILFACWIGLSFFFIFNYLLAVNHHKLQKNRKVSKLYTSMKSILLWSFFYNHYKPTRVFYVIYDIFSLLTKSLIIGLLQSYGSIQVACLIILEFIDLVFLFAFNPYFVKFSWISSRWILPVARFFVTVLCIPYIPQLQLSEAARTYVAYVQLLIHCVVAFIFIVQLFYGFTRTILSIIKFHKERLQYKKYSGKLHNVNSVDDINREFEYKPVNDITNRIDSVLRRPPPPSNYQRLLSRSNGSANYSLNEKQAAEYDAGADTDKTQDCNNFNDEVDEEKFYFRGVGVDQEVSRIYNAKSKVNSSDKVRLKRDYSDLTLSNENIHQFLPDSSLLELKDEDNDNDDKFSFVIDSDLQSFTRQEKFSNLRKQRTDYRVREGDNIYKKYFIDDEIDPEIKALWESRNNWGEQSQSHSQTQSPAPESRQQISPPEQQRQKVAAASTILPFKSLFKKKSLKQDHVERGFQVSRPKQLVVRTIEEIHAQAEARRQQQIQHQEDEKADSIINDEYNGSTSFDNNPSSSSSFVSAESGRILTVTNNEQ